jgi:hypothetical protein
MTRNTILAKSHLSLELERASFLDLCLYSTALIVCLNNPAIKDNELSKNPISVPFKTTNAHGHTFNPYPSYEPPHAGNDAVESKKKPESLIFKPSGVTGSYPIRSIIESNIPLSPPWE